MTRNWYSYSQTPATGTKKKEQLKLLIERLHREDGHSATLTDAHTKYEDRPITSIKENHNRNTALERSVINSWSAINLVLRCQYCLVVVLPVAWY